MRQAGQIVLVACYEMGHQPWNLASPLAYLQEAGYSPVTVDTAVEALPDTCLRDATLVAISVPMHTALRLGVMVAERVRQVNPSAHINFYGMYAWLNRDYLLPDRGDSVIAGEFEAPLLALAQALEAGEPLDQVPGVSTAAHDGRPHIERLSFTVPSRTDLPALDNYARFRPDGGSVRLAGYVEASRGCLHTCRHCPVTPIYQGRFFVVPREVVLEDIRTQVEAGARHITFGDPDFLNGPGHVMKILREMHERYPDVTFDATIKIEHIREKRHLMPELRRLGCAFILSAVESFSDRVLAHLQKGHTRADIAEALTITRAAGIPLRASFVAFTPWMTIEDYLEMLDFIEAHDMIGQVDPVQYAIRLLIPPNSALLDEPDTAGWLGELDGAAFTYRWTHPDSRLDDLHVAVSRLVEEADRHDEPVAETFYRVKALAYEFAGRTAEVPAMPLAECQVAPGLTESWFC